MNKLKKEYLFFKQQEPNMRTLLVTNMLYALVLPIVEIFVGAYIMRNTSDPVMVAFYQLAMYIGIITTSLVNGYLLKKYSVKTLYSIGILVSGISMFGMMTIKSLGFVELGLAGFLMGAASGFFWTNRYLLALYNTNDNSRNYFFGLESFFYYLHRCSFNYRRIYQPDRWKRSFRIPLQYQYLLLCSYDGSSSHYRYRLHDPVER